MIHKSDDVTYFFDLKELVFHFPITFVVSVKPEASH